MKQMVLLSFIMVCFGRTTGQSYFPLEDFLTINNLYVSGRYAPFADKLHNFGFELYKKVSDYELNGVIHRDEYSFKNEQPDPKTNGLMTIQSVWKFRTEEHPLFTYVEIDFDIYTPNADNWFRGLSDKWASCQAKMTDCDPDNCMWFSDKSENFSRDIDNAGALVELDNKLIGNIRSDKVYNPKFSGFLRYTVSKFPLYQPPDEYLRDLKKNRNESIILVPIVNDGKISKVSVSIGGKSLTYIIDSGASDIGINESTEKNLKELGAIRATDYLPDSRYQLADGSIKQYRRVTLPVVNIGGISIESVQAYIVTDSEPLLLGKSFLNKFSYWKIDNDRKNLELRK